MGFSSRGPIRLAGAQGVARAGLGMSHGGGRNNIVTGIRSRSSSDTIGSPVCLVLRVHVLLCALVVVPYSTFFLYVCTDTDFKSTTLGGNKITVGVYLSLYSVPYISVQTGMR